MRKTSAFGYIQNLQFTGLLAKDVARKTTKPQCKLVFSIEDQSTI